MASSSSPQPLRRERIIVASYPFRYSKLFVILVTTARVLLESIGEVYCRLKTFFNQLKSTSHTRRSSTLLADKEYKSSSSKKSVRFASSSKTDDGKRIRSAFVADGGGRYFRDLLPWRTISRITNSKIISGAKFSRRNTVTPVEDPLLTLSASEMAEKVRSRKVTCRRLLDAHIQRLRDVDSLVHCIAYDNFQKAADKADSIDANLAKLYHMCGDTKEKLYLALEKLKKDKPLLGVPFTCKESFSVKGMPYAVGLKWRSGIIGNSDADVVKAMKEAGAVLMATTTVPEMCFWWETHSSVRKHPTKNPHDFQRTSGGSSGGEGAAIAACASPLGIGSDYYGSIRYPAAFTGIYGHKPSHGLCTLDGHYPYTESTAAVAGPMAREVRDLKLALSVLSRGKFLINNDQPLSIATGNLLATSSASDVSSTSQIAVSSSEPTSSVTMTMQEPNTAWKMLAASSSLAAGAMTNGRPIRFLTLENFSPLWHRHVPPMMNQMVRNMTNLLLKLGHIVQEVEIPALNFGAEMFLAMEADHAAASDESCDPRDFLLHPMPGLEDKDEQKIRLTAADEREGKKANVFLELAKKAIGCDSDFCLPTLLSCATAAIVKTGVARNSKFFQEMRKVKESLEMDLEELLGNDAVLLMPTAPHVAPLHQQSYFMPALISYTGIFNVLGLPVTQIPIQHFLDVDEDGKTATSKKTPLPIGLQIVGWKGQDALTLEAAEIIERLGARWTPPWED